MRYTKPFQTRQTKHRFNTKIHAKEKYKQLVKNSHKNVRLEEPGMMVLQPYPLYPLALT